MLVLTIAGTNFAVVGLSAFYYLASDGGMTELPELSHRRAGIWIAALSFAIWIALYEIATIIWHLV
jgi:hypothetical protein